MTAAAGSAPCLFRCRGHAGRQLARHLQDFFTSAPNLLVLGLPRGGVVVAQAVADALDAECDLIVARKLGVPGVEEVAFGAIAEGCDEIEFDAVRSFIGIPDALVTQVVQRERLELQRRVHAFRGGRPFPTLGGMNVILVDDGMASGATMRAAARAVRKHGPASITVAVPVASRLSCDEITPLVDRVVTLHIPDDFATVSDYYDDFAQVGDDDVRRILGVPADESAMRELPSVPVSRTVQIPVLHHVGCLAGDVGVPGSPPHGLVIFAHGGGSSRHSYRNVFLAGWLQLIGWATLRVDLLLPHEQVQDASDGRLRFDVALITERLCAAVDWAVSTNVEGAHNIMLFGASTGASAALFAAAERPDVVRGVMSRAGRVDLAAAAFDRVQVPVLMVVGTRDPDTLRGNRSALLRLRGNPTLRLVRGAGHTFEEPGALGAVGRHVEAWLTDRLTSGSRTTWIARLRHSVTSAVAVLR